MAGRGKTPIFGGAMDEIAEAKRAFNERFPNPQYPTTQQVTEIVIDHLAADYTAVLDEIEQNKNKPRDNNLPITEPGPRTKYAMKFMALHKDLENKTLDEIAVFQAEASNKIALNPSTAPSTSSLASASAFPANEDTEMEVDGEDEEMDEETSAHAMEVIKAGRRENKPIFVGTESVPRRKISTKTAAAAAAFNPRYNMSLDDLAKLRREELAAAKEKDPSSMSLEELITKARTKNKEHTVRSSPYSFRSISPSRDRVRRVPMDAGATNLPSTSTSGGIKSRLGGGGSGPRFETKRKAGFSAKSKFLVEGFWYPKDEEIGKWLERQDKCDNKLLGPEEMYWRDLVHTPEKVVHFLTENGYDVEYEAFELNQKAPLPENILRDKRWKVIYTIQNCPGSGIASRKELAKQMAAFDALRKVHERLPEIKIPFCQVPLADRVNPWLAHLLARECHNRGILLKYDTITETDDNCISHTVFTGIYSVDGTQYFGYSLRGADEAKKMAAKAAYEGLTQELQPYDPLIFGPACAQELQHYLPVWSEAHHVYDATDASDVKYFTKTNLFGRNASAIEEAARKLETPVDPEVVREANEEFEREKAMLESLRQINIDIAKNAEVNKEQEELKRENEETLRMVYPNGAQLRIPESLESRTRRIAEKVAAMKKRYGGNLAEQLDDETASEFSASATNEDEGDADDSDTDVDATRRSQRRDW